MAFRADLIVLAVAAIASCGGSSDDTTDDSTNVSEGSPDLRPAAEVEAERLDAFEFDEPVEIDGMTVIVSLPVTETDNESYYGAQTWTVALRAENRGSEDLNVPNLAVRCADGENGQYWINSTIAPFDPVPAGSFAEGNMIVSAPIDEFGDPAVLHDCQEPRLMLGSALLSEPLVHT